MFGSRKQTATAAAEAWRIAKRNVREGNESAGGWKQPSETWQTGISAAGVGHVEPVVVVVSGWNYLHVIRTSLLLEVPLPSREYGKVAVGMGISRRPRI